MKTLYLLGEHPKTTCLILFAFGCLSGFYTLACVGLIGFWITALLQVLAW